HLLPRGGGGGPALPVVGEPDRATVAVTFLLPVAAVQRCCDQRGRRILRHQRVLVRHHALPATGTWLRATAGRHADCSTGADGGIVRVGVRPDGGSLRAGTLTDDRRCCDGGGGTADERYRCGHPAVVSHDGVRRVRNRIRHRQHTDHQRRG